MVSFNFRPTQAWFLIHSPIVTLTRGCGCSAASHGSSFPAWPLALNTQAQPVCVGGRFLPGLKAVSREKAMFEETKKKVSKAAQGTWSPPGQQAGGSAAGPPQRPEVSLGKMPFSEIQFIRLADVWQESQTDGGIFGGLAFDQQSFRQYQFKREPTISLDFWFRGEQISSQAGQDFLAVLTQPHVLSQAELVQVAEVLGPIADAFKAWDGYHSHYRIESAEAGLLRGRPVMSVRWEQQKEGRRFLSLFFDASGDGRTIHELHFSTPKDRFEENLNLAIETFKSIQWASFAPPPLSTPGP